MRYILALLLALVSAPGQSVSLSGNITLSGSMELRSLAVPVTPSVTVDYWQNWEFGSDGDNPTALNLEANRAPYTNDWTIGGTTTLLIIRTAGQQAPTSNINGITDSGTRGLESDINGANTGARYNYMLMNKGAVAISYGLRFKANSLITTATAGSILSVVSVGGTIQSSINLSTVSGNPVLVLNNGSTSGSTITLAADTWYWLTVTTQNNATSTLQVFNGSGSSQGTSSVTSAAQDAYFLVIGNFNTYTTEIGSVFYDNLIVDVTDATFPLGP